MRISTKGRYALRLMLDLAEHQGDGCVSLKDVAQRQDISKKYLEQIVPTLSRAGFLLTNRGYQGGYRLARRPEDYTARDILRLTEGSLAPWPAWTARSTPARAARIARLSRSGRAWTV